MTLQDLTSLILDINSIHNLTTRKWSFRNNKKVLTYLTIVEREFKKSPESVEKNISQILEESKPACILLPCYESKDEKWIPDFRSFLDRALSQKVNFELTTSYSEQLEFLIERKHKKEELFLILCLKYLHQELQKETYRYLIDKQSLLFSLDMFLQDFTEDVFQGLDFKTVFYEVTGDEFDPYEKSALKKFQQAILTPQNVENHKFIKINQDFILSEDIQQLKSILRAIKEYGTVLVINTGKHFECQYPALELAFKELPRIKL